MRGKLALTHTGIKQMIAALDASCYYRDTTRGPVDGLFGEFGLPRGAGATGASVRNRHG